jgi:hypothetical protein
MHSAQMKTRTKIIVGVFLILIVTAAVVVFACDTSHSYFDLNNGRVKTEYASFGRTYREAVEETEYSKLLKKFGFEELPADWKPANSVVRRFLETRHVHHRYAKLPTDATTFALGLQLQEKASEQGKREQLAEFRTLVREGTPKQVHEYLTELERTGAR